MIGLVAMGVRCNCLFLQIGNVNLAEGGIQHVPLIGGSLLVFAKYCIVGKPATATELTSFPNDYTHICQHVSDPLRVDGSYDCNVLCKDNTHIIKALSPLISLSASGL
jgi:hypothetical protein